MADHETFRRAIVADPADDGPRLVYADWLEETGQTERAEFVRVQCELARLRPSDPRGEAPREREAELERTWGTLWRTEFPDVPGMKWGRFERGFVSEAIVTDADAFEERADLILTATPVTRLTFGNLYTPDLGRLTTHPAMERIERLSFDRTALGYNGGYILRVFADYLSGVRGLTLRSCQFEPSDVAALIESPLMPRLRQFALPHNLGLGREAVRMFNFVGLPGLEELDLTGCRLDDEDGRRLAEAGGLSGLRFLTLAGNQLGPAAVAALAVAFFGSAIEELDLSNNRLVEAGMPFPQLDGLPPNLRTLNLSHTGLSAANVRLLAGSPALASVHELRLRSNQIEEVALRALVGSPHLGSLWDLDLGDNPLGARGVRVALDGPWMDRLARLDLSGTFDGPDVARVLARGGRLGRLRRLWLTENSLTDVGVRYLAEAGDLAGLRELSLARNDVGNAGAEVLCKAEVFAKLRRLVLVDNPTISRCWHRKLRDRFGDRVVL